MITTLPGHYLERKANSMKTIHTMGLMGAILTAACVAGAQGPTNTVGVPLDPVGNPGGTTLTLVEFGYEGKVSSVGEPGVYPFTTTFPGDRVLVNSTGGNDPSNWLAVVRFFNPLDPTGNLGLSATETQGFFPSDVAGGFAKFSLFPKTNFVPSSIDRFGQVVGTDSLFGPVGGINARQLLIINFIALPAATPAATPEPDSLALLIGLGASGAGFLARSRRRARKTL